MPQLLETVDPFDVQQYQVQHPQEIEFDHFATTTLGDGNEGEIGPDDMHDPRIAFHRQNIASGAYRRIASRVFMCIDGRFVEGDNFKAPDGMANPQIAGGLAVTGAAVRYSLQPESQSAPLSRIIAEETVYHTQDGYPVIVHGTVCGANDKLRTTLHRNGAQAHIVAPIVGQVSSLLGTDRYLDTKQTTSEIIAQGYRSAANEALWDLDHDGVVDIALGNGASKVNHPGSHKEIGIIADLTDGAFDEESYAAKHPEFGQEDQVFVVSLGAYRSMLLERSKIYGWSRNEVARRLVAAVAFQVGTAKRLVNMNMPVEVYGNRLDYDLSS